MISLLTKFIDNRYGRVNEYEEKVLLLFSKREPVGDWGVRVKRVDR
jgi:hypothetical protein